MRLCVVCAGGCRFIHVKEGKNSGVCKERVLGRYWQIHVYAPGH